MRRLSFFSLLLAALVAMVVSCDDPDNPDKKNNDMTPAERISTQELTFVSAGGTQTITISGADDWTCESYSEWFKATKSGSGITVTANANPIEKERSGEFTVFFNSGEQLKVSVRQTDPDHDVEDPTGLLYVRVVPVNGVPEDEPALMEKTYGVVAYAVKTNGTSWEATVDQSWVTLTVNDVYLTAQAEDNTSQERRKATITVTAKREDKTVTKTVTVIQKEDYKPPVYDNGVDFTIYNTAFFVDSARLSTISAADTAAHTVTFAKGTSIVPEQGSVMVVPYVTPQLPEGLLGRVTSVNETADGYVVTYGPATIEEAFASIDIPETEIDLGEHVKEIRLVDGTQVEFVKTKAPLKRGNVRKGTSSGSTRIDIPEFTIRNLDRTVAIDASATIDLGMKFSMQTYRYGLYYFGAVLEPTLTVDVKMDANVQKDFVKGSYPVMTVLCGAFPLGPVVITPLVEISFVVGADGKMGLKAGLKYVNKSKMKYTWAANGMGSQFSFEMDDTKPDNNAFSFEDGALYMEGGIYAGFDTSIGLGVYGTLIYGTVGCQETIRCGGTFTLSAEQIGTFLGSSNMDIYPWNFELSTDYVVNGVAAIKSFGTTITDVKTDDYKTNIDKRYPFPQFRAVLVSQSVGSANVDVYCRCAPLVPAHMGVLVYAKKPGEETYTLLHTVPVGIFEREDKNKAVIPPDETSSIPDHCWNKFSVSVNLDYEGVEYVIKPYAEMLGVRAVNYKDYYDGYAPYYNPYFRSGSTAEGGFRAVLEDLMTSLKNDDPSARLENWGSDCPLNNWHGVIVEQQTDGSLDMYVNPNSGNDGSKWYLNGDVYIGSHTSGKCTWTLDGISMQDKDATLTILDRNCQSFPLSNNRIKIVSDKFDDLTCLPAISSNGTLKSLELTGDWSFIENLSLNSSALTTVSLDGLKKLNSLTVTGGEELKTFTLDNLPRLGTITFKNCDLTDLGSKGVFLKDHNKLEKVLFVNCKCSSTLKFANLPELMFVENEGGTMFYGYEFTKCFGKKLIRTICPYDFQIDGIRYRGNGNLFCAQNLVFDDCNMTEYAVVYHCLLSNLYWTSDCLTIKGCKNLTSIDIEGQMNLYNGFYKMTEDPLPYVDMRKIVLQDLPALQKLSIVSVGLREFEPSLSWSAIKSVNVKDNRLTGTVPGWIEAVKGVLGQEWLNYDRKYDYFVGDHVTKDVFDKMPESSKYKESPYGFWYPAEPGCYYHYQPRYPNGPDGGVRYYW